MVTNQSTFSVLVPSYSTSGPKSSSFGSGAGGEWYFRLNDGGGAFAEADGPGRTMGGSKRVESALGRTFEPGTGIRETATGIERKSTFMNAYCRFR